MNTRIGAVSYLNSRPLIYGLRRRLTDCDLHLDLPSRLADALAGGQLDVALIPSVEFLRDGRFSIVADPCIACRGAVRSVRVLFRRPPQEVRSLALDVGSRTSAALVQVLLADRFGLRPQLQALPIDARLDAVESDAVLVIGDRAMRVPDRDYVATWDLGEEWYRDTGLPFVFAMWVTAAPALPARVSDGLQAARDEGLQHLDEIARAEAPRHRLSHADCMRYFREQLHFQLGIQEQRGLDLFRSRAAMLGLLPESSKQLSLIPQ